VTFLPDAGVISEARKPAGDPNVRAWLASVPDAELYVSVLVIGEVRQGIERLRRRDPARVELFEAWLSVLLHDYLLNPFDPRP
jgi:hypothetical protein